MIRQLLLTGLVAALGGFAYVVAGSAANIAADLSGTGGVTPAAAEAITAAAQTAATTIAIATVLAVLVMAAVSVPVIHFTIGRPMKALAETVAALTRGEHDVLINGETRTDEIGAIARGLEHIRGELAGPSASTAPVTDSSPNIHAKALSTRIASFSGDLAKQVQRLGVITKRLGVSSEGLIIAAKHANEGSDQATNASSNAAGDVSSVATASEQLLDSIEEISRQVVQSTNVVKAAVERAVETNAGMGRLSAAAQKVGDVVSLISRIAAQTNLLALNATIEAARAGEAGRGFAVVAQEVKTLATQTAKATQDITGQIAEMQEATELSVEAIDKIQKKISEVEHISTIIAAAVHEQGAATQEIARNVRSAAAGTATMSSHVENVVRSVGETSSNAAAVATLVKEFDEIATSMTDMVNRVNGFAQAMEAA